MEYITNLIETSISNTIVIILLLLITMWLLIRSAVKSGVKSAIKECYNYIVKIEADPELKANITKSPEQELKEELEGW